MTTTPDEPLSDEEINTTAASDGPAEAEATVGGDADGTDGGDADGTDGGDADGTDA
jgi:hypothetical protein